MKSKVAVLALTLLSQAAQTVHSPVGYAKDGNPAVVGQPRPGAGQNFNQQSDLSSFGGQAQGQSQGIQVGVGQVNRGQSGGGNPNMGGPGGGQHGSSVSILPTTSVSTTPQIFEHEGHSFNITPMSGMRLQVMQKGTGKSFNFLGPLRSDGSSSLFAVTILVASPGHAEPSAQQVMHKMLSPYKQKMKDFASGRYELVLAGGKPVGAIEYSGTFESVKTHGFFSLVPINGTYFVISASDLDSQYAASKRNFARLASSLVIQG